MQQLASVRIEDGDALLLAAPARHLEIALDGLLQLIYEVEALDQRPRLERLGVAA